MDIRPFESSKMCNIIAQETAIIQHTPTLASMETMVYHAVLDTEDGDSMIEKLFKH